MSSARRAVPRIGMTLLEIIVSVAILGLTGAVATLTIRRPPVPNPNAPAAILADSLERVLATGYPATLRVNLSGRPALATIGPDGSVVADSVLLVDRFTGRASR